MQPARVPPPAQPPGAGGVVGRELRGSIPFGPAPLPSCSSVAVSPAGGAPSDHPDPGPVAVGAARTSGQLMPTCGKKS